MTELTMQKKFIEENQLPDLAPINSGMCWSCGKQVKDNGKTLITSCDKCHRSFCE